MYNCVKCVCGLMVICKWNNLSRPLKQPSSVPRSRALLEKLILSELVHKSPTIYETTVSTKVSKIKTHSASHAFSSFLRDPKFNYNVHWKLSCNREFACHCAAVLACKQMLKSWDATKMSWQRQEYVRRTLHYARAGSFYEIDSHSCVVENKHTGLSTCILCMKFEWN